MASFTPEQLKYLKENFAPLPHTHNWDEIVDPSDGQTVAEAFENLSGAIDELGAGEDDGDEDEEEEDD